MHRILINATDPEEIRVAFVEGQTLQDLDVENRGQQQKVGNIYKAKVTKVQPNIGGIFLDYGFERSGFLSLKQTQNEAQKEQGAPDESEDIKEGQDILVQVAKDERREKGVQLSTDFVFKSRYLDFLPNTENPKDDISDEDRAVADTIIATLKVPAGMGVSLKKGALTVNQPTLVKEFDLLLETWKKIAEANSNEALEAPALLYQNERSPIRVLRDYFTAPVDEIIVDEETTFKKVRDYVDWCMPDYKTKVFLHDQAWPLFKHYNVDKAVEQAFERTVELRSGGTIVIDPTEALIAIDVNSARAKGNSAKKTAFNTNMEAVIEIARQLRIRDLSGLIVVDFIGMSQKEDEEDAKKIHRKLQHELRRDRATTRVTEVSKFGMVEIERQRLRLSLQETVSTTCPICQGYGHVPNVRNQSLRVLRRLNAIDQSRPITRVDVNASMEIAGFMLNNRRVELMGLEKTLGARVTITPTPRLQNVQFEIREFDDNNKVINFMSDKTPLIQTGRRGRHSDADKSAAVPTIKRRSGRNIKELVRNLFGLKGHAPTAPPIGRSTHAKPGGKGKKHSEDSTRQSRGRGRGSRGQTSPTQSNSRQRRPKPGSQSRQGNSQSRPAEKNRPAQTPVTQTPAPKPTPAEPVQRPQQPAVTATEAIPPTPKVTTEEKTSLTALNDPRTVKSTQEIKH